MRLNGFRCDRCGKVVTDANFCALTTSVVGMDLLEFFNLKDVELCEDCYEKLRRELYNTIAGFMGNR